MDDTTAVQPSSRGWEEVVCRDDAVLAAPPEAVWAALADLATWSTWWTLIRVTPHDPSAGSALVPGTRFRVEGGRSRAASTRTWDVEVKEVVRPARIELEYIDGDLVGRAAWEVSLEDGGTRVAFVYRGVRANSDAAAATFARYGTRLHSLAMQVDALAGLARYLAGEPLDDAWRAEVDQKMARGVAALDFVAG